MSLKKGMSVIIDDVTDSFHGKHGVVKMVDASGGSRICLIVEDGKKYPKTYGWYLESMLLEDDRDNK